MCGFYSLLGETDDFVTTVLNANIKEDDDKKALQIHAAEDCEKLQN